LSHKLGFPTICRKPKVAGWPRVAKWNRAEVLTARLLGGNPLDGPLGVEFALEFGPDDGHREEGPAIGSGGVDLLRDANEVDVLLADASRKAK